MDKSLNRNIGDPGVIAKPVGSTKIAVLNGSRQIDRVIERDGKPHWQTQRVKPVNGLPSGIHYLDSAQAIDRKANQTVDGQILHTDKSHVYQFNGDDIVKHDRRLFDKEPVVGGRYQVAYEAGRVTITGHDLTAREPRGPYAAKADDLQRLSSKAVLEKYPNDPEVARAVKIAAMAKSFAQERLRNHVDQQRFERRVQEHVAHNLEHGKPNHAPDILRVLYNER